MCKYIFVEIYCEELNPTNKLSYVYDFGDDWIHDITLEDIIEELHPHASCTAGKGVCPEEDCGGLWGYEDMNENGEVDDPKYFDLEAANKAVKVIKPEWFEPWVRGNNIPIEF